MRSGTGEFQPSSSVLMLQKIAGRFQVIDKTAIFHRFGVFVGQSQEIGWMYRHHGFDAVAHVEKFSAACIDRCRAPENGIGGGCS